MNPKLTEKGPRKRPLETEPEHVTFAREQAARVAAELAAPDVPADLDLSPEEIAELEREREMMNADTAAVRAIAENQAAPKTAREFAQARLAQHREGGALDAAVAQQNLETARQTLEAKTAELAEAEARDRSAAEEREREREALRLEVGAAETVADEVRRGQVSASLAARVAAVQEASAANREVESTDETEARAAWIARAKPLVATIENFLVAMEDWLAVNEPILTALGKVTWESTDARWHISIRAKYADRAAAPARELLSDAKGGQAAGLDALTRYDVVAKGRALPTDASMVRIVNAAKFSMVTYVAGLNRLDTSLARVEEEGKSSIKGDHRPTVRITTRTPTTPRDVQGVTTSYDVHARTSQ